MTISAHDVGQRRHQACNSTHCSPVDKDDVVALCYGKLGGVGGEGHGSHNVGGGAAWVCCLGLELVLALPILVKQVHNLVGGDCCKLATVSVNQLHTGYVMCDESLVTTCRALQQHYRVV